MFNINDIWYMHINHTGATVNIDMHETSIERRFLNLSLQIAIMWAAAPSTCSNEFTASKYWRPEQHTLGQLHSSLGNWKKCCLRRVSRIFCAPKSAALVYASKQVLWKGWKGFRVWRCARKNRLWCLERRLTVCRCYPDSNANKTYHHTTNIVY